jgi:hypothetical protein
MQKKLLEHQCQQSKTKQALLRLAKLLTKQKLSNIVPTIRPFEEEGLIASSFPVTYYQQRIQQWYLNR